MPDDVRTPAASVREYHLPRPESEIEGPTTTAVLAWIVEKAAVPRRKSARKKGVPLAGDASLKTTWERPFRR